MLEMEIGKVIGTKGGRIFRGFDSFSGLGRGKRREVRIKRELVDLAVNLASEGVLFMGNGRGILFVKTLGNGEALGEGFGTGRGGEGDGLVRWLARSFSGQVSDEAPKGGRIRRGRGGLDRIRPTRPRGRVDDIVDFAIEASDVRVGRVSAPDRVTLTDERDRFVRNARVERFTET